jgi:hypothetical protein
VPIITGPVHSNTDKLQGLAAVFELLLFKEEPDVDIDSE